MKADGGVTYRSNLRAMSIPERMIDALIDEGFLEAVGGGTQRVSLTKDGKAAL